MEKNFSLRLDNHPIVRWLHSLVMGYDHQKYWRWRQRLVDPDCKLSPLKRLFLFWYIKRLDARKCCSFGTNVASGAKFLTPPLLPHGPGGIIVGHDAEIGADVTIFQQVTIAHGGVVIGNHVLLGAGAKVLPGVRIGHHARVGANCVVVEDIPDYATVVLPKPRIILKNE